MGIILVVEDVHVNRKLIVRALKKMNFKVDEATNGQQGLEMMLKNNYRTVYMDINMPIMNGNDAIIQYKKQVRLTNIPKNKQPKIYLLSGDITHMDRQTLINYGADDCLSKPITPEQLKNTALWAN